MLIYSSKYFLMLSSKSSFPSFQRRRIKQLQLLRSQKKTGFSAQEQLQAIAELETEGIDGLVISPFNDTAVANKIDQLQSRQIPVITTNTDIRNSQPSCFCSAATFTAAGRLLPV